MFSLRVKFINRFSAVLFLVFAAVLFVFTSSASANILLQDSFNGTTIDTSIWKTGQASQFTQNNGLSYYGDTVGSSSYLVSQQKFSGNFDAQLFFNNFVSRQPTLSAISVQLQ